MSAPRGSRGRGGGRGRSRDASQTRNATPHPFDKRMSNSYSSALRGAKQTLKPNGTPRLNTARGQGKPKSRGGFSAPGPITTKDQNWRLPENAEGADYKGNMGGLWQQVCMAINTMTWEEPLVTLALLFERIAQGQSREGAQGRNSQWLSGGSR